jgi:hypothetical protein
MHGLGPFTDMTSDTVILAITAAIAVTVATPGLQPAGASVTVRQVRNSNACLPSLADPPDLMVPFKDGKYASPSIPFAEMRAMASGQLDGKPVVVSEIVWNTGGSGNWEIVALFRESTGQAINQGVYWPAPDLPDGGTMVGRIEIRDNTIRLYGEDPLHHRTIATPLVVTTSAFTRCQISANR